MTIKFSVNKQAFYDENTDVIPDDAVVITNEQHLSLISGMNDGERRVYIGTTGELTLSDSKPSQWHTWDSNNNAWVISDTEREQATKADAENMRAALRSTADTEISWRQDAVDAGIATDEETAALVEWKQYRVLLMRVDITKPVWPTPPASVEK
ncbi:tail fiber assembly protein [Enterobacter roggenkampii]|uniref:tail fiber assembly protein n=1 Tax=Enterobacter roggenkampii TaxID=1812935 RepID=UPI000EFC18E1|nr:tail fiber assembly protein [Enterobacter roggenkampii]